MRKIEKFMGAISGERGIHGSQAIKRSLASLIRKMLNEPTTEKITVKELVKDAGANRQPFYYHFHDMHDLLEWVI